MTSPCCCRCFCWWGWWWAACAGAGAPSAGQSRRRSSRLQPTSATLSACSHHAGIIVQISTPRVDCVWLVNIPHRPKQCWPACVSEEQSLRACRGIGGKVSDTWGGIKEGTTGFFSRFRKAPLPIVATTSPAPANPTTPFSQVGEPRRALLTCAAISQAGRCCNHVGLCVQLSPVAIDPSSVSLSGPTSEDTSATCLIAVGSST
jgi:hypothetical protein